MALMMNLRAVCLEVINWLQKTVSPCNICEQKTNYWRPPKTDERPKTVPYPASAIANELIKLSLQKTNSGLSPMKVQKLVYFAHGWYLALTGGRPMINEPVEAWKFGPVVPSLYYELKKYGETPITDLIGATVVDYRNNFEERVIPDSIDNGPN